ncbi:MAG: hypothetical protein RSC08_04815, partial [Oscillospiraceae bacterium]
GDTKGALIPSGEGRVDFYGTQTGLQNDVYGTVASGRDFAIVVNEFLTIKEGATFTNTHTLTNNGTITGAVGGTGAIVLAWNDSVACTNSLTATGAAQALTADWALDTASFTSGSTALQFSNTSTNPFKGSIADGVYDFKLTALPSAKDAAHFMSYYNAIKSGQGFDTL